MFTPQQIGHSLDRFTKGWNDILHEQRCDEETLGDQETPAIRRIAAVGIAAGFIVAGLVKDIGLGEPLPGGF